MSIDNTYCRNCRKYEDSHAAGKCLFSPTPWEPVIWCGKWGRDGAEADWVCPGCRKNHTLTKLDKNSVTELRETCTNCGLTTWILA